MVKMPCFSASNIRFISAEQQQWQWARQQQRQHSMEQRAKTTTRISNQLPQRRSNCGGQPFRCDSYYEISTRMSNSNVAPTRLKPGGMELRKTFRSKTATLSHKELERLKSAAKVISIEERLEALTRREQLAKQLDEQTKRAREHFRKIDEQRLEAADNNQNGEDIFVSVDKQKTLDRAFVAKHEQEEEIKAVNRIILNAKCHAVRDAQVQEKHDIERDQKKEEERLEKMVINEAQKALVQEDCHAEMQKVRNAKYASEVRQQLLNRQYLRFMEAERAEEEARVQREAAVAIKIDEQRQAREAWERRQKFREELNRVVEMSNLFKKMLREQEQEADMRVAAYMREKHEREKELMREKKLAKEEFERQQEHLFKMAQKVADTKAHRDELTYIRERERVEREYRRREKELATRKKQLELEVKTARERQMQETKARRALQIAREEKDFNILIEKLKNEETQLKKLEKERQKQREKYRLEIIQQMGDRALAKQDMREYERLEANLWREAENKRLANIRTIISAKLAAMREACLPERYIRDVERQLDRYMRPSSTKLQETKK